MWQVTFNSATSSLIPFAHFWSPLLCCKFFLSYNTYLFLVCQIFLLAFMLSCSTLFDPMDYSPPDSFVHGIFWARILEWAAIFFSLGSSRPRDWTRDSSIDSLPLRHLTSVFRDNKRARQIHKIEQAGKYESKLLPLILWFCVVECIFFHNSNL